VDPTWYNQRYYEKVSATKPPKRTLKHQLSDKVMRFRWHYLLAASLVMMLVAKKYSKVQIWQLLIKRGFELGVVMFAISLVFSIKQFMHHQKSQVESTHSLTHRTHSEEHMTRGALITLKKAISQASEAGAI
jgi:choline-glycine betaine transporter